MLLDQCLHLTVVLEYLEVPLVEVAINTLELSCLFESQLHQKVGIDGLKIEGLKLKQVGDGERLLMLSKHFFLVI
jgi:hypothetical protein